MGLDRDHFTMPQNDSYTTKAKKYDPSLHFQSKPSPYSKSAGREPPDPVELKEDVNNTVVPTVTFNANRPTFYSYSSASASINSPNSCLHHHPHDHVTDQRRHPSKELFTIHQHSHSSGGESSIIESQPESNLCIASILVVTYLIEVAIQIFFIVQSLQQASSWSAFLSGSSLFSSFLVTCMSLIWVFRKMDFRGKICGKLLCYVIHLCLQGILWRYLKLAFAFDKADLSEFLKLKTIQTYVQCFLVSTHLAWVLLTTQEQALFDSYHVWSTWLVVAAEMLCVATSLLVLSTTPSFQSSTCRNNTNNLHETAGSSPDRRRTSKTLEVDSGICSNDNNRTHHFNDSTAANNQQNNHREIEEEVEERKYTCGFSMLKTVVKWMVMGYYSPNARNQCELGRALLLLSRVISLGILMHKMNYYWTVLIILVHLFVSFAWLGCWALVGNNEKVKNPGGNNVENFSNKSAHQNEGGSDTCETRSSTSNDSGLVKSEVVMENGIPVIPEGNNYAEEQDHNNVDYERVNGRARDQTHLDFNSFNALSNCLTQVIIQRNNGDKIKVEKKRTCLMLNRILPLTYVLFWDLNFSPAAHFLRNNRLSLYTTAVPMLLAAIENVVIMVYSLICKDTIPLNLASAACLLFGWTLFISAYHFQVKSQKLHPDDQVELDIDDSGYGRKVSDGGGVSNMKKRNMNKKETGECLSLCCSSLSHPLNIKRKGHRDQLQPTTDNSTEDNNFCKNDPNNSISPSDPATMKTFNEYEEQPELGKLMHSHSHQHHRQHNLNVSHNSNDHSRNRKGVTKNSINFPDLGLPSDHSGVRGETVINLSRECLENNVMLMACAKPQSNKTACASTPESNIKEALTRRISNKSCSSNGNSRKRQTKHHHHHPPHDKVMNQDECESVKGEGEVVYLGREGKGMISSFKSSSSSPTPSIPVQRQPPPPPSNSNKCMPISIKSPISWIPESCCNDSSLGSGSSNSRNTNTLVTTTTSSKLLYCPDKYIDLDNNNVEKTEKRTGNTTTSRNEQRLPNHHHHRHQNHPDFSVVFFEDRSGSCGRSYKQKQSRTPVASSALLGRATRSANATPVAVPIQLRDTRAQQYLAYREEKRDDDDDPIVRMSTRLEGKSARLRNQITGKTYLSDGASLTSLDGLCEIRASTPVEIKKASRVIVNYPPPHHQISDSKTVSRCLCRVESSPSQNDKKCVILPKHQLQSEEEKISEGEEEAFVIVKKSSGSCINNNNLYEKLIDDSYGILICESEHQQIPSSNNCIVTSNDYPHQHHHSYHPSVRLTDCGNGGEIRSTGIVPNSNQKLRILCAKCLENHDPLLTNCLDPLQDHPKVVDHYAPNPINAALISRKSNDTHQRSLPPHLVSGFPCEYDPACSDTTDYPSDTEFTATVNNAMEDDGQSLSTHFSSATYTWQHHHPHHNYPHHYQHQPTQLSQFIWAASQMMPEASAEQQQECPKEFTGLEYVRTWLLASHPRTFAAQAVSNSRNGSRSSPGVNNTRNQHPHNIHNHRHNHPQQENGINTESKRDNKNLRNNKGDKRVLAVSSSSPSQNNIGNNSTPFKNKSAWQDNRISKKKRFRQLEKRQRPIGRGASPPVKELCASNDSNPTAPTSVEANDYVTTTTATLTTATTTNNGNVNVSSTAENRFQPPPSRKQHPLLFYDMMPRQEEQKPLTVANTASHKKCRDQLDLFHKELETVV